MSNWRIVATMQLRRSCRVLCSFSNVFSLVLVTAVIIGCADQRHPYRKFEPPQIVSETDSMLTYGVVEIPAGTTELMRLDTTVGKVVRMGEEKVDFLPFPGNYGFVSGTMNPVTGRPLELMVMMHALSAESVIPITPVAVLQLQQGTRVRDVVVAIPSAPELQSIRVDRFVDFITEYEAARHIIQEWFINYQGFDTFELLGWQDELYARTLISRMQIPE